MSGKGSSRRKENFKQVQDNWPASMGKKPYWMSWSKFSDEFNKTLKDFVIESDFVYGLDLDNLPAPNPSPNPKPNPDDKPGRENLNNKKKAIYAGI